MKCPECNTYTRVLRVRETLTGMTRRRECPQGHRFTTHERVTDRTGRSSTSTKTAGGTSTAPSGAAEPTWLTTLAKPSGKSN